MTKKEIINTIIQKETEFFEELSKAEDEYGMNDPITNKRRAKWSAIYELMEELKIEG